jgi:branched-chain amino acid transport system substrate-binding protein
MKTKIFLLVLLWTLIVVAFPLSVISAEKPTMEVIVGNISAMTGPTSITHLMCQSGSKDYLTYLNEEKGGIEGKKGKIKVRYLTYDSQYVASKAKDGFSKFKDQGMIVLTHCAAGHADALMDDHEQAKIPLVTGSLGLRSMVSDWIYGNYHPGSINMNSSWILWVKSEWEKARKPGGTLTVGTLASDEPPMLLSLERTPRFAKEHGIKFVLETIPKGTTDASPQLLRLKEAGAWQIYVLMSAPGATVVLNSSKTMKLNIPLTQSAASSLGEVIALAGPELAEGYQGEYFFEPMSKNPELPESPGMKLSRMLWNKYHPGETPRDLYVDGILSGMIIAEGMKLALNEIAPEKLNGETLKIYGLDRIRNFTGMGLTAPISYTPGDHLGQKHVRYYVVRKGYVEPISDWRPTTTYKTLKE